jgi:hypothetical protein
VARGRRRIAGRLALGAALALAALPASGAGETMPDVHPPIGVRGEIAHANGTVMLSYRYQRQDFEGLMNGQTELDYPSPGWTVLPTALRSDTHLLEVMWAPLDEITFVLTLPYLDREMDQVDVATGLPYTTEAKGFGDFVITVLYRVFEDRRSRVHLNLGISLPAGSTNESQVTPVSGGNLERLPYAMQLGSGTVDLRPGFTYNGTAHGNYWGGQVSGVLHAGTNSRGYRFGDSYSVTGWFGRRWTSWLGTGFRLDWSHWFDPEGADPLMQPARSPAENATLQAGQRLDALFSLDLFFDGGGLAGTRLSVEAGLPAYQNLDGPQLATDWILTAGLQYAF